MFFFSLNCAILNDSFLLTPSKNIEDSNSGKTPNELDQNPVKVESPNLNLKENAHIENKAVIKRNPLADKLPAQKSSISLFSHLRSTSSSPKHSDSGISTSTCINPNEEQKRENLELTSNRDKIGGLDGIAPLTKSPPTVKEINFITPKVKFQVTAARNNQLRLINTNKKSREEQENEFKSQKILFATPLSVQRPQLGTSANDCSISLVLDDTPIKSSRKNVYPLSPIKENNVVAKKSSEKLFDPAMSTVPEKDKPK